MTRPAALFALLAAGGALLLPACGSPPHGPQTVACSGLPSALAALPRLRFERAEIQPADDRGHPAHCLVQATLNARSGPDGRRLGIGFEMRLPVAWNQRLLHHGDGGDAAAGSVSAPFPPAWGDLAVLATDALSRGFAVFRVDPVRPVDGVSGGAPVGGDPRSRRDIGHAAADAAYPLAQALVESHYGRRPQRSYIAGCGEGGRQAMVAASRHPERYDGYLAGAPGFNLPRAALQYAWDIQAWKRVDADVRKAFSPADLRLVADRVLARCDGLDLLVDGLIADPARCRQTFRPAVLQCTGARTAGCLGAEQVQALERSFAGPYDSGGGRLYSDWLFDAGIASEGWQRWKLGSSAPQPLRQPANASIGASALAQLLTTPPTPLPGTAKARLAYLAAFDFDRDAPKIAATDPRFRESVVALMTPPDADEPRLAALAQRGGKLLVYQGISDPVFSVADTLRWTDRLQANLGLPAAQAVARVFPVPGMGHCHGGPATDRFDALGALVDWVEKGQPPDRLLASVAPANAELPAGWSGSRSRPLCPWPQVARYRGGDIESADSFRCSPP